MKQVDDMLSGKAPSEDAAPPRRVSIERTRSAGAKGVAAEVGKPLTGPLSIGGLDDRDADLPDAFLQVCRMGASPMIWETPRFQPWPRTLFEEPRVYSQLQMSLGIICARWVVTQPRKVVTVW